MLAWLGAFLSFLFFLAGTRGDADVPGGIFHRFQTFTLSFSRTWVLVSSVSFFSRFIYNRRHVFNVREVFYL